MISSQQIASDGSDRKFLRVSWKDKTAVKIIPAPSNIGFAEANSFYKIGRHLGLQNLPVPDILYFDEKNFEIIVEDLGDVHFQTIALKAIKNNDQITLKRLYREVLRLLLKMQEQGSKKFDISWCYDTCYYDSKLALEREAYYFLNEFVKGIMGVEHNQRLIDELKGLSASVSSFSMGFLVHRDFQSRNIMVKENALRVIDFQGARLGPAGYDAASIIFDPYVPIPADIKGSLLQFYCTEFSKSEMNKEINYPEMQEEISTLAILRLMQTLGAYSFLMKKGKGFFSQHIKPALNNLKDLLENHSFYRREIPELTSLVNKISHEI